MTVFTSVCSPAGHPDFLGVDVEGDLISRSFLFRKDGTGVVDEVATAGDIATFCRHPGKGTDMESFLLREVRIQELNASIEGREDAAAVYVVIVSAWAEKPELLKESLENLLRQYEEEIAEMAGSETCLLGDSDPYDPF